MLARNAWTTVVVWLGLFTTGTVYGDGLLAVVGGDGGIRLTEGREELATIRAGLYNRQWAGADANADVGTQGDADKRPLRIAVPGGGTINGSAEIASKDGELNAHYEFVPAEDVVLNSLHVGSEFSIGALAGGRWTADGKSGVFPQEFGDIAACSTDRCEHWTSSFRAAANSSGVFRNRRLSCCRTTANGDPHSRSA